jgi:ribonuclease D
MQTPAVALDTEFVRERTFYPELGLIQLAIKHDCYLIDPVAISNLSALGKLLAAPEVTKILHDPQQDLMILKSATGTAAKNIFDTRMAYGFSNGCATLSLAALLSDTLKIHLPKTETRANWLMRPLTEKMFDYACDDVRYLCDLMNYLIKQADAQNTSEWLIEEMKIYDSPSYYSDISPREYFRKIRGGDQVKGARLAALQKLAEWREKTARRKNRPRGHIVQNNALLVLAARCPTTTDGLKRLKLLSPRCIKRYGSSLINCIQAGLNTPPEERPASLPRLIPQHSSTRIYKEIQHEAARLNIDPSLVCSRKDITILINSRGTPEYKKNRLFKGWRNEFMQPLYQNPEIAEKLLD